MHPLRRTLLFAVAVVAGLSEIVSGGIFGWTTGLVLLLAAFVLIRRWWLPRTAKPQ